MVDVDLIKRKLILIENKKRDLNRFPVKGLDGFKHDIMMQKAVEKLLEEMVQICIDVGKHIVADEKMTMPDDNTAVFDILAQNRVITDHTSSLMKKMVGFRNILVHMYERVDVETVYINYRKRLSDFDVFTAEVLEYLESGVRRKA